VTLKFMILIIHFGTRGWAQISLGIVVLSILANYYLYQLFLGFHIELTSGIVASPFPDDRPPINTVRLGFGSPEFDPSCQSSNQTITIDGEKECFGSQFGNYLASLYLSILRAKQRNNSVSFVCRNGSTTIFDRLNFDLPSDFQINTDMTDLCSTCTSYAHSCETGLNHAFSLIKSSLQKIRVPNFVDDVTIHFRCGDILSHPFREYGYPRYNVYQSYLSDFNTLGILTAPLSKNGSRSVDYVNKELCHDLLLDMVRFFSSKYPNVTVTIRSNDSLEDAIGRLLHSKQSWCNPSTFCLFPTLATLNKGFILDSKLYPFVRKINTSTLTVVQEKMLSTMQILKKKMKVKRIISWLRS
jgi:hypothetical protein